MKSTKPRRAINTEIKTFMSELAAALEATRKRLARIESGEYELRVSNVGKHDVSAHSRGPYPRLYLARVKK